MLVSFKSSISFKRKDMQSDKTKMNRSIERISHLEQILSGKSKFLIYIMAVGISWLQYNADIVEKSLHQHFY